jgi:hypothetical protein
MPITPIVAGDRVDTTEKCSVDIIPVTEETEGAETTARPKAMAELIPETIIEREPRDIKSTPKADAEITPVAAMLWGLPTLYGITELYGLDQS